MSRPWNRARIGRKRTLKKSPGYLVNPRCHRRSVSFSSSNVGDGEQLAVHNVVDKYRILGRYRLSARWYERAAVKGDGDALVDWGHCLQHGMGVRMDSAAAELAYRAAIKSNYISDYGREEAMYLLAVLLTQSRPRGWRREASTLLRRASADGDYPQAASLIEQ